MGSNDFQFIWGPLNDTQMADMWNTLAYPYSPQYHSDCIQYARQGEKIYALLIKHKETVVYGGVFIKKSIRISIIKISYLEFGIPLTVQCSFIKHNEFQCDNKDAFYAVINSAFKDICKRESSLFVICKAINEETLFGAFTLKNCSFCKTSPVWIWNNTGSFEEYMEKLSGKRRRSIRKMYSILKKLEFSLDVVNLEDADLQQLSLLLKKNCEKYNRPIECSIVGYFKILQRRADNRVKILQISKGTKILAFDLTSLAEFHLHESVVSLTGSETVKIPDFSLYDILFINVLKWMMEDLKWLVKCNIGQGCDMSKAKLGAVAQSTLASIWIKPVLVRYLGNGISKFVYKFKRTATHS
jgi:hypothetical protein